MTKLVTVTCAPCIVCKGRSTIQVPEDGFEAWRSGTFAQIAFPDLSAADRELLISGTHAECWGQIFPPDLS